MRITALNDDGGRYEQYQQAYLESGSADQKSNILAAMYFDAPDVVLAHLEFSLSDDVQAGDSLNGLNSFVYVLDDERRAEITATLARRLSDVEGVLTAMRPAEFTPLGVPDPDKNPEAPHLVLTTGPGYSFDNSMKGDSVADAGGHKGSHGHD
ncbi:MAG: hypothetical protein GY826_43795, partial [Fuerstiella sp.]|nr:hypothetical protein [Fuerstiella sp.]